VVESLAEDHDSDGAGNKRIAANKRCERRSETSLSECHLLEKQCSEFAESKKCQCWQKGRDGVVSGQVAVDDFEHDRSGAK